MNILIPMAGAGKRFSDAGYSLSKPLIPTTSWREHKKIPMVIAATQDLILEKDPKLAKPIYILRDFHIKDSIDKKILQYFPLAKFIVIDQLTEGQASSCLLAKGLIDNQEELLIGGCDNGQIFDNKKFLDLKKNSDVLIFTYRNNPQVLNNPNAYGWVSVAPHSTEALNVSVKKPISNNPLNDHAIVATFWFKNGSEFVSCAEKMIQQNDRINNEFYVDQVMRYAIDKKLKVRVFEIEKYLGWGTPSEYENYEKTFQYWSSFLQGENI